MARNRVGVLADGDSDVVAADPEVPTPPAEKDGSAVALERKKQKKPNELLRKKKAERRAQAKQRKQAQVESTAAGDEGEDPAFHEQSLVRDVDIVEDKTEETKEHTAEEPGLPIKNDEPIHTSDSLRLNEDLEPSWTDSAVSKGPASPPPALPAHPHEDQHSHEVHTEPESPPPHSRSPPKDILISDQQHLPQESSVSVVSEAATLSVDEADAAAHNALQPKKVKKKARTPDADEDDHVAAAKTIQKALKKSLLKKTKHTLQKAKSFIRHSSKVLADDSSTTETQPQPLPSTRPVIVPPLALKPRSPPPSSSSSVSDAHDESERSASSSSGGSSPTRTASRPSSSGSSNGSSYSSRSSSSASEASPPRHKKRGRKQPTNGPSVDMLLFPPMPREDHEATNKAYGELHHHMAMRIQARVRGIRGRSLARQREIEFEREIRAEALREVEQEASVRIQAHIKGFLERRRLGIHNELDHPRKGKRKNHQHHQHKHPYTKPNSVMPQGMVKTIGEEPEAPTGTEDDESKVAEWPEELNYEPLDAWDELNSVATPQQEPVTTSHFLSRGKLRVFCGTWNLHAKKPTDDLRLWIPSNKYHVVAVGTEECVHSIAKSVVFTSKKQWEDQLKETLGDEYVLVAAHSLTAIHNVVFVHESLLPYVHSIQSDAVATGLGNQLGNKGGVGIAFMVGHTSLAFVNCHFDAHQHNVAKRNANFHRINQELQLTPVIPTMSAAVVSPLTATPAPATGLGKTTTSRFSSSRAGSSSALSATTASRTSVGGGSGSPVVRRRKLAVSESFDRVFWYGDLNYRINGTRRMIDLLLLHNHHAVLRFNDQLRIEMAKGNVFAHFQEGPLHFRPTYKFDKHSNVYDSGPKQRIPSWTDRILYLSNEKPHDIELLSYRSHMNFQTSDHRPVGAVFQVNFSRDGVPATGKGAEDTKNATVEKTGGARESIGGGGGAEAQAFARVLAKGYKSNQTRSEVCVVQ